MSLMFTHIGARAMLESIQGSFLAWLFISFVILMSLKSIRLGVISILPNVLPCVGVGLWALVDSNIGFSQAPVLGVTMGNCG